MPARTGTPRVSVLVPCFDDGALIGRAIASVREEEPIEIVVVDDGSRDEPTLRRLSELESEGEVTVVRHESNRGLPAARTTARKRASAPYVFALDADDELMPGVLRKMADRLDADPGLDACFGDYQEFGTSDDLRRMPPRLDPFRIAYINEYPTSALFRAEALETLDAWQGVLDDVPGYEDWNLWMAFAENGLRGEHVGRGTVTFRYRQHDGRMLAGARERHRNLYREMRRKHPRLFSQIADHRRRSDLPWYFKAAFPVVYGERPLLPGRSRVKKLIAKTGIVDRLR